MRFRATIEHVPIFFRIVQAIEKLQKTCLVKFTETQMHIICNNDANEGGIQVWSQIKVDAIFRDYRIQSNANNEISMSLAADALLAALRSSSSSSGSSSFEAEEVVMKLAKKDAQAVLSFEIEGVTRGGRKVRVAHDVRIEVLRPVDVARLSEPLCPEPDVHILLPPLQKLRTIVERMRPMSDILAVRANGRGRLQLAIDTEGVRVETEWRDCTNPQTQDEREDVPNPGKLFSVLVSTKSFTKFLNSHVISTTTIACICQNHCMILYVYIGDVADAGGVLTFYIPLSSTMRISY
ncbi:checkpoint protein Hus1/Mec3 [Infundibulicybe gibba]|nr:checkpoint protein Hus1/Mec3 [Infundibulicybe gibba]